MAACAPEMVLQWAPGRWRSGLGGAGGRFAHLMEDALEVVPDGFKRGSQPGFLHHAQQVGDFLLDVPQPTVKQSQHLVTGRHAGLGVFDRLLQAPGAFFQRLERALTSEMDA